MNTISRKRLAWAATTAACALLSAGAAQAAPEVLAKAAAPAASDASGESESAVAEVVVTQRATRSAVALPAVEIQKLLPGINPLKAIQTLPGVLFQTADPWGNNEQNLSLFVHGFSTQQLGYTLDSVPLGDQQYGNYNGLSVSRAISSENVSNVVLSSGAGSLGVASTSNLGGAIETFSREPSATRGIDIRQTFGSYDTFRTFARVDTGDLGNGRSGYLSYVRQDARAWDFDGQQGGHQINAKFVQATEGGGKLTLYADWQTKVEPNEDATAFGNQQTAATQAFTPYSRPFIFPNLAQGIAYLQGGLPGSPPVSAGNNFRNYFSAAQRADVLGYAKYEAPIGAGARLSVQGYGHYDYGRGIVAGPINQAGLPGLFSAYFPQLVVGGSATSAGSLQNLVNLFGGTGYEVRTTEYSITRGGVIANLNWEIGNHAIEAGLWYEHNRSTQHRKWYPFSAANNDLTPYDTPKAPAVFEQYAFLFDTDVVQLHLQDAWRILPTLTLQAGVKASLQTAGDTVLTQQRNLPTANPPTLYPTGSITTNEGFLPQFGALWDVTEREQVFVNAQKNLRQFIPYGAGSNFYGSSPWSLGSQAAFDLFRSTVEPETSWTYEVGLRSNRPVSFGPLTGVQAQLEYYHVDFSNRLFNVAAYNFINPGASILVNVGGVTTDGVDLALTLAFGPHFRIYNALSYNKSTYDDNYLSGANAAVVPIAGKQVPLTSEWLNKSIVSVSYGPFEGQLTADYVGDRPVTYLNDLYVAPIFQLGLQASYAFELAQAPWLKSPRVAVNVSNLNDEKGVSTAVVTGPSGGYQGFPLAPRQVFVTLSASF